MTRNEVQRALLERISGGGSVPARQVLDDLADQYGERTVKVEFANLVLDGTIREHPDFNNCYVVSDE